MEIEIVKIHKGADNLIVDTYDKCILANIMLEFDVNNKDKDDFVERLSDIIKATSTSCYAWSLLSNHVHLLLRTGRHPIATVMRRLLTGHAITFNRQYRRHGQLFHAKKVMKKEYKTMNVSQDWTGKTW